MRWARPREHMAAVTHTLLVETTSEEVTATFAVTPRARALLRRWQEDPGRPQVARMVTAHTRVLYRLRAADIEVTCAASDHLLGNIRKEVATAVQAVVGLH